MGNSSALDTVITVSTNVRQTLTKKGKTVPLEAWGGPEGPSKLRFPDFLTTAQYGGKVVSLYPQEIFPVLISVRG
jgi:hypothetical protein